MGGTYTLILVAALIMSPYLLVSPWENFIIEYGDGLLTRVIAPWLLMMAIYWIYGGLFIFIDYYHYPKFIYNLKYQTTTPGANKQHIPIWECIKVVLFNQIFIILPLFYLLNLFFPLNLSISPPSVLSLIVQTIEFQLLGEFLYYFIHRSLHHRLLYKYIHKKHHIYKTSIGIASLYAHPLEIVFGNVFALIAPVFFVNCDLFSFYVFIVLGFIDSITDHCGYALKQRDHDIHHEKTIYNYGSLGLLDYAFGTCG